MKRKLNRAFLLVFVMICLSILMGACGKFLAADVAEGQELSPTPSIGSEEPEEVSPAPTLSITSEEPQEASPTPTLIVEPKVDYASSVSPNGQYRGETYGKVTSVTSGGYYPNEGIRVIELSSGRTVWGMEPGYYACSFLWSEDSRFLAVSYMARIYGNVVLVNLEDGKEIVLPVPEEIEKKMREYRPDPYFFAEEWVEDAKVRVSFEFVGQDEKIYTGSYCFSPVTEEISDFEIDEGTHG